MAGAFEIHVISDSTGETGARVARAVGAQFDSGPITIIRHPRVTTVEGLGRAFVRVAAADGPVVIFHSLIDEGLRRAVEEHCGQTGIACSDLIGPPLAALAEAVGVEPERRPGAPVPLERDYFQRVAAMEFAVKHDDGLSGEGLGEADIVLVGVSRTSKTPLSMYLGYLGYKTANVPLVLGIQPPASLYRIARGKIVGLEIDPQRLAEIRGRRMRAIGSYAGDLGYARLDRIYQELEEAAAVQRRLGCPVIDVTAMAVEEAANRVIELVESRSERG